MKYGSLDQSTNGFGPSDRWSRSQRHGRYFENIGDISSIFMIFYQYISDILSEIPAHENVRYTSDISAKYRHFPIFHRNIGDFPNTILIFRPIDYRFAISYRYQSISYISIDIKDFLSLGYRFFFFFEKINIFIDSNFKLAIHLIET